MAIDADLILRLQSRTPRYTSYPTAPVWRSDIPPSAESVSLSKARSPASVYIHLPFCEEQCSFCACNMVVAGRREAGRRYLKALDRQLSALPLPRAQHDVLRVHLGGGTPTWFNPEELSALCAMIRRRFSLVEGGEVDVEVDPEITTDEQIDALAALGVTRISMGVQSFDHGVLEAVGRPQRADRIGAILERARKLGMKGLNIDLMYGLPRQDADVFARDLDATIALAPDRLAVFGYAHVPWLKPHQKRLEAYGLQTSEQRLELFLMTHDRLRAAGYLPVGFDHFAKADDDLAKAAQEGRLHRNFMGYTTLPDVDVIGLGMSAITELHAGYFQQKTKLAAWWKAAEAGKSTLEKGLLFTEEDRLRKDVIHRIMCNMVVDWTAVASRWKIDPLDHFADGIAELKPLVDLGLVELTPDRLLVTEDGRLLVRRIASAFDAYLPHGDGDKTVTEAKLRFSQLV